MLSFDMTYDGRPEIESWEEGFKKWLSAIEIDREKYDVKIVPGFDCHPGLGKMEVTYDGKLLFAICLYRRNGRNEKGQKTINAMFTVSIRDEGMVLMNPGEKLQLNIDDKGGVNYLGKQTNVVEALMDVLPLREEEVVAKIASTFDVSPEKIQMDTYQKRYVIDTPIPELKWVDEPVPDRFYKYVPLKVFHLMLLNGTFRMNSIISQSDTQETFYIGDLVCSDYEDEYKRFRGMLMEQKTLISSFTTKYNDVDMWKTYGDNGQGACLCFHLNKKRKFRQMRYIDESESPIMRYKKLVDNLNKDNIHVHFTAVDDIHRFVKNIKYKSEDEWRLVVEYDGDVDYDIYGNRCVSYKDFKFEGCDLSEIGLHLDSILIGPNQPEGTSNFPLLTQRVYRLFGDRVPVNMSKLDVSGFRER